MMELTHELDVKDLALLKSTLGSLQMVGRFGYKQGNDRFVDIMKGIRILQNMAEYIVEKIGGLEVSLKSDHEIIALKEKNTEKKEVISNTVIEDNTTDVAIDFIEKENSFIYEPEINLIPRDNDKYFAYDKDDTISQQNDDEDGKEETCEPVVNRIVSIDEVGNDENGEKDVSRSESNECEIINGKKSVRCKLCLKKYTQLKSLKNHTCHDKYERIPCTMCNKQISKGNISHHMKTHKNFGRFGCENCDKTFKDRSVLEKHQQKEVCMRKCKMCGEKFTRMKHLLNHIARIHGINGNKKKEDSKPISCKYCHYACESSSDVRKHMRMNHLDEAIPCDSCDNIFFSERGFNDHKIAHSSVDMWK